MAESEELLPFHAQRFVWKTVFLKMCQKDAVRSYWRLAAGIGNGQLDTESEIWVPDNCSEWLLPVA